MPHIMIDWPKIHEAFTALDAARILGGIRIGYDGLTDALGGSYFAPSYESRGLAGAVQLLTALQTITEAAWKIIHKAADRRCRCTSLKETAAVDAEVRSAVAVMLAARPAYDALADIGICERDAQSITRGNDGKFVYVTGLHWIAGVHQDRRVTIEQAQAVVNGKPCHEVFSERDEAHNDQWWG